MNLQSDEVAERILNEAKNFDVTARSKDWNGNRNRLVARMYFGHGTNPGLDRRSEITVGTDKIYWWIGLHTPLYEKYGELIDEIGDEDWKSKHDETRIIFESLESFFAFTSKCLGKVVDINVPATPKALSVDGAVVVCPRCDNKFQRAERCPECGQLIKY